MGTTLRAAAALGLMTVTAFSASGSLVPAAGNGTPGFGGDGELATVASVQSPTDVAWLANGGYLIADRDNNRVRRVTRSGVITTVAGSGIEGVEGDGGRAVSAQLSGPAGVAATPDGGFVIADQLNSRVRRVSRDGRIETVAGPGALDRPSDVVVTDDGTVLVADQFNHRIRSISPTGVITTVAGSGAPGDSGDDGPATEAELNLPSGIAVTPEGHLLIADQGNHRVRKVDTDGTITTVAGSGLPGFDGDGGPATIAQLDAPAAVAATPTGGFVIADQDNARVRVVGTDGRIATLAENGLDTPAGMSVDGFGTLLVADTAGHDVDRLAAGAGLTAMTRSGLRLAVRRVTVGTQGARVAYVVNTSTRLQLWVRRPGHRAVRVATRTVAAGPGVVSWNGRLSGRRAPAGRYTLVLTADHGVTRRTQRVVVALRP